MILFLSHFVTVKMKIDFFDESFVYNVHSSEFRMKHLIEEINSNLAVLKSKKIYLDRFQEYMICCISIDPC